MGSEWMTGLSEALKNVPLNRLAIPGSHDSGAYNLTTELSPDAPTFLKYLSKIPCIQTVYNEIVHNISDCQNISFRQQLDAGIRHFDLRVSSKADSPCYYIVHSVYGGKINDALNEIKGFLDDHPGEVVILDFQQFHSMDEDDHRILVSLLKSTLGLKLCEKTEMKNLTLNYIRGNGKQVICIYQHDQVASKDSDLWSSESIESPWPNTTSPDTCVTKLTQSMEEAEDEPNNFFVCQGVLTPSVPYILTHLCCGSVRKLTKRLDPVFNKWLDQSPTKWLHEPNIVIHDFVEEGEYIQHVVNLNKYRG